MAALAVLVLCCCLGVVTDAQSCQCSKRTPFLGTVAESDLVVRGEIDAYGERQARGVEVYESLVLRVKETLRGSTESKKIVIRGGDGKNCVFEIYPRFFEAGGEYVFSVKSVDGADYTLQSCAESWLRISEGIVRGAIASEQQSTMTYEELAIHVAGVAYQPESSRESQ